jgi:predicted nucleic acid-binding protein
MRRVVFDSTVLISGFLSGEGGLCHELLALARDGKFELVLSSIVRDPEDDMVLACAADGRADTIVSRDKDLLSLGTFGNIAIITPEVFRQQLRNAERSG